MNLEPNDSGAESPLSGEMLALAMQADGLDGQARATSAEGVMEAQAEEQALDQTGSNAREVRMMLAMGVPIIGTMFPSIPGIYTDEQCDVLAAVLAPVMTKYGINLGAMSDKPEFAALIVCGPLAFATYKGIQADIADRKKQLPKGSASNPMQAAPVGVKTELNHTVLG